MQIKATSLLRRLRPPVTACLRGLDARHRERGFTLVEIAIAIFIITLLLGSFLVPLTTQVEQRQVSETQKMLEDIKEALIGHAIAKGYLPCPDRTSGGAGAVGSNDFANDGIEDYNTGTGVCFSATATGNVPWVTLGLGASDPWGNRFRYRVTAAYGQRPVLPGPPPTPALFNLSTAATLGVTTTSGGTLLTAANPDGAVAVILSHGKNGFGAWNALTNTQRPLPVSADEVDNLTSPTFTSRVPTAFATPCGGAGQPLCEFDDIVIWIGKYTLYNRMVAAGKLP